MNNKKAQIGIAITGATVGAIAILAFLVILILGGIPWLLQHFAGAILIGVALALLIIGALRGLYENKAFLGITSVLLISGLMFTFIPQLATIGSIGSPQYGILVCEFPSSNYPTWGEIKYDVFEYGEVTYPCDELNSNNVWRRHVDDFPDYLKIGWWEMGTTSEEGGKTFSALADKCSSEGGASWGVSFDHTNNPCPITEPIPDPIIEPPEVPQLNLWQKILVWFKSFFSFEGWGL